MWRRNALGNGQEVRLRRILTCLGVAESAQEDKKKNYRYTVHTIILVSFLRIVKTSVAISVGNGAENTAAGRTNRCSPEVDEK